MESFLYSQGFSKVTLQPEFPSNSSEDIEEVEVCNLKCKHEECAPITCCNESDVKLPTVEESGGIYYLSERKRSNGETERLKVSETEKELE